MRRSAGPLSAAPAMMGETATTCSRRAARASRTPATARSGPTDTTGSKGRPRWLRLDRSRPARPVPAGRRRLHRTARLARPRRGGAGRNSPERPPRSPPAPARVAAASVTRVRTGSSVTGNSRTATPRRVATAAVTELSESPERSRSVRNRCVARSRSPRRNQSSPPRRSSSPMTVQLSSATPHPVSRLSISGQRVGDRVDVGTDVQAVQDHVVADVDDRRDVRRRHDANETREHPGGPDAAAQGHQHAASIGATSPLNLRHRLVPSPPAMPAQIPVDRHRTVVSVLREAALVNGDVEAYVEPVADWSTRHHLRRMGPGRRRCGGVSGQARRRQGRRGVPPPPLVDRLRRALRSGAPSRRHHLGHQPAAGRRRGDIHRRADRTGTRRRRPGQPGRLLGSRHRSSRRPKLGLPGEARHPPPGPNSWPTTPSPSYGPAAPPGSRRERSSTMQTSPPSHVARTS